MNFVFQHAFIAVFDSVVSLRWPKKNSICDYDINICFWKDNLIERVVLKTVYKEIGLHRLNLIPILLMSLNRSY